MRPLLADCIHSLRADSLCPKEYICLRPCRMACSRLPVTAQIPKLCTFCGKSRYSTETCLSVSSWWVKDNLYNPIHWAGLSTSIWGFLIHPLLSVMSTTKHYQGMESSSPAIPFPSCPFRDSVGIPRSQANLRSSISLARVNS